MSKRNSRSEEESPRGSTSKKAFIVPDPVILDSDGSTSDCTDSENYCFIKFHKSLQPLFDDILKQLLCKLKTTVVVNQENTENTDELRLLFNRYSDSFTENKELLDAQWENFSTAELVAEVKGSLFNQFKSFRSILTKWFGNYERISQYMLSKDDSHNLLNCRTLFSDAIRSDELKNCCVVNLKNTLHDCEKKLRKVDIESSLDSQINEFHTIKDVLEDSNRDNLKCLIKAYRVVLKSFGKLSTQVKPQRTYADVVRGNLVDNPQPVPTENPPQTTDPAPRRDSSVRFEGQGRNYRQTWRNKNNNWNRNRNTYRNRTWNNDRPRYQNQRFQYQGNRNNYRYQRRWRGSYRSDRNSFRSDNNDDVFVNQPDSFRKSGRWQEI